MALLIVGVAYLLVKCIACSRKPGRATTGIRVALLAVFLTIPVV